MISLLNFLPVVAKYDNFLSFLSSATHSSFSFLNLRNSFSSAFLERVTATFPAVFWILSQEKMGKESPRGPE